MQRRTLVNLATNTGGTVVQMLSSFVVMPFLISRLGNESYGLWVLIGSLLGYFQLLDFGTGSAIGRLVAFRKAQGDIDGVNEIMSTALAILIAVGLLICAATLLALGVFFNVFAVPPEKVADVEIAIIIAGASLAINTPASAFYAMIWGYERFDLQNAVDIPIMVARVALIVTLIDYDSGLAEVALLIAALGASASILRVVVCFRIEPALRIRFRNVTLSAAKSVYSFASWMFVAFAARNLIDKSASVLVGIQRGAEAVTTFSVAKQLSTYTSWFLLTATGVVEPKAIALHAQAMHEKERILFLQGGRFALSLVLLFVGGLIFLGRPFISLWLDDMQNAAYVPMLWLIGGEAFALSQLLSKALIVARGALKQLATLGIGELVLGLPLALLLSGPFGMLGVCLALGLAAALFRGVGLLVLACDLANVPYTAYLRNVVVPSASAAALPIALLAIAVWLEPPSTWISFLIYGAAYTVIFSAYVALRLLGLAGIRSIIAAARPT